jgi:hypothetical protein
MIDFTTVLEKARQGHVGRIVFSHCTVIWWNKSFHILGWQMIRGNDP